MRHWQGEVIINGIKAKIEAVADAEGTWGGQVEVSRNDFGIIYNIFSNGQLIETDIGNIMLSGFNESWPSDSDVSSISFVGQGKCTF